MHARGQGARGSIYILRTAHADVVLGTNDLAKPPIVDTRNGLKNVGGSK